MKRQKPRILLGVTADMSIRLMWGFPQYLARNGWDVHIVSSPGQLLDELAEEPGVSTHPLKMARKPAPFSDLLALGKWVLLLRAVKPDITSVGTPKAGLLGGIAGWIVRVPARVYLLRGLPLETTRGLKFTMLAALERLAFRTAHKALAVSPSLRARAIELGVVSAQRIAIVGAGSSNGVDDVRFSPSEPDADATLLHGNGESAMNLGLLEGVPVIGFVGRLTEDKGLTLLAEALDILGYRGVAYQLLIVGGVDDSSGLAALERLHGGVCRPVVTGHVANTAPLYRVLDVLCLPTRREGFPNVVIEAAATGVPTVTTDATGAIDSVVDGETGFVIPRNSASAMAEALTKLLESAELRHSMGQAARRRVYAHYRQMDVWAGLERFYLETAHEARSVTMSKRRRKMA